MRRPVALLAVGLLVAALLASCTPAPATELPDGVSIAVRQNRDDYGPRRLEVLVTNGTASPLEVQEARFDSSAFTESAATSRATTVRPGTTTALRLQLAPPDCAGTGDDGSVRIDFRQGDVAGTASVAPDDPLGSLPRIHTEDCLAQRLADAVTIVPGDSITVTGSGDGAVAHLAVTLTPTGAGEPVTIDSITRTILLRPASGDEAWPVDARVDSSASPLSIELAVVPNNCNTHTVSEDKRGTFLPVTVTFDDGSTGVVPVGVTDEVRGAIYTFIAADYCGWE